MLRKIRHIHFVGVGGSGMSGIAEVLLNQGYKVSGSDLKLSPVTDHLRELGAQVFEGHEPQRVEGADVVVVSTAVRPDNPEVQEAKHRQVPVIPRAEMLAELMRLKYSVAVAGAHGKTTTTSMIGSVLAKAGLDPTIVVGGRLRAMGGNAMLGQGEYLVAEADESDRSFLKLSPTFAVVTNIDREHLDYYRDLEDIQECFIQFVNKVPFYGSVILCLDDPNVQAIMPRVSRRMITYGWSAQADVAAGDVVLTAEFGSQFVVSQKNGPLGLVTLQVPGWHNVYNALAAIAVGLDLDVPFSALAGGLAEFRGVSRRFEFKGDVGGVTVFDDYGHHPTEIRTTLAAAKLSRRRLVVLFQPHRYSRTRFLLNEFAVAFNDADVLLVADIYAAGEDPIQGITSEAVVETIKQFGHKRVSYSGGIDQSAERLADVVQPGDLVLTLGAGNVYRSGEELIEYLKEKS